MSLARQLAVELALRAALTALQDARTTIVALGSRKTLRSVDAAIAQAQAAFGNELPADTVAQARAIVSPPWSRAMIMAATDLELRGRLALVIDRVGWEAQTIRAELRARADERIRDNGSPGNVISAASRFAKGDAP